jgi:hypothetical protein
MSASAQSKVLTRCPFGPIKLHAPRADQTHRPGDPIGPVFADLHLGRTTVTPVDLVSGLDVIKAVAQCTRRTVADGANDHIHPSPAWCDTRL